LKVAFEVAAAAIGGDTGAAKAKGFGHGRLRLRDWRVVNGTAVAAYGVSP
jgi:hypothetical protein